MLSHERLLVYKYCWFVCFFQQIKMQCTTTLWQVLWKNITQSHSRLSTQVSLYCSLLFFFYSYRGDYIFVAICVSLLGFVCNISAKAINRC